MKKTIYTFNVLAMTLLCTIFTQAQTTDTLSMGPGYAFDVFYSMENGEVSSEARDTWDIAFYTQRFSAGILSNDGKEVSLYTYPNGDTSDWSSIDTTGMSGWPRLYNGVDHWENGVFQQECSGTP